MKRRHFLQAASVVVAASWSQARSGIPAEKASTQGMFKCLSAGAIGVKADQWKAVEYAERFGFGGVEPHLGELRRMAAEERRERVAAMKSKGLRWGAGGLPVEFRAGDPEFEKGMAALPEAAKILQEIGVTRVSTWILPGHDQRTYRENFEVHRKRLGAAARVLKDHGLRLGLEFVGPRTSMNASRYPFVHTQKEMLELANAIGTGNVGLLLDSWHWYTSGGTLEELQRLTYEEVVDVHVNDAPAGIPMDQQVDNRRALPCATGVIDAKGFIGTLRTIGYDGPILAEPFDRELNAMDDEAALDKTSKALDCMLAV